MTKYALLIDAVSGWTGTAASVAVERPGAAHALALAALDTLSRVRADAARQRREKRLAGTPSQDFDFPLPAPTLGAAVAYA